MMECPVYTFCVWVSSGSTAVRAPLTLTRNVSLWLFQYEEDRRFSPYQWTWIFLLRSSEESQLLLLYRMSTLGITSNLNESTLWPTGCQPVTRTFYKQLCSHQVLLAVISNLPSNLKRQAQYQSYGKAYWFISQTHSWITCWPSWPLFLQDHPFTNRKETLHELNQALLIYHCYYSSRCHKEHDDLLRLDLLGLRGPVMEFCYTGGFGV